MRKYIIIPAFAVIFLFAACKKTIDSLTNQLQTVTQQPATTSIGSVTGNAVSKTIGSSGGSITSEDGKLELIVPAGAVNSDTVFSIQPISNYCPGGLNAFRLLPDGMTFSIPVTLKFNYTNEDVNGSLAALFTIAYQGKDNIWYSLPATEIDSVNKTISVQTTHFTDWSDVSGLKINSDVNSLRGNQEAELTLEGTQPETHGDDIFDLNTHLPMPENQTFQAKWYVNGVENGNSEVGEITVSSDNKTVQYKAPAIIKIETPITISAELTDLNGVWLYYIGRKSYKFNKIILIKQIVLVPDKMVYDFHLESTSDGACGAPGSFVFDAVDMQVVVDGDNVTITNIANQVPSIITPSVQSFNCTVTASAGPRGPINITSATGFVYTSSQSPTTRGVTLAIVNSETSTENCSEQCANSSQNSAAYIETDSITSYYSFDLVDSVQSFGTQGQGGYWTFTPN